jgi:hypothetical protein
MEAKVLVPVPPRARFQRVPRATDGDSAARPDLDARPAHPTVTARSLFTAAIRQALGQVHSEDDLECLGLGDS